MTPAWSRLRSALVCLLLLASTSALYWPATTCDFVNYDDDKYVLQNAGVQQGLSLRTVAWAFSTFHASNWHPLTWLSHAADWQFFGSQPQGHHFTNVLLHILNTCLVFLALKRLTGSTWGSAVVAALFGWHPTHVESVAWVAERKDVLSVFFGLLALYAYAAHAKDQSQIPSDKGFWRNWASWRYALSLTFFGLALLSKPMLVSFPLLLLMMDFWPLRRPASQNLKGWLPLIVEKMPFLCLSLASCVVTLVAQSRGGALAPLEALPLLDRTGNALVSLVRYVGNLLWPTNLAVLYPLASAWPLRTVFLCGAFLLLITWLAWKLRLTLAWIWAGWLWFVIALLPVIGLIQVGEQAMADRYLYLPSIGFFLGCVWTCRWAASRVPQIRPILLSACAIALCASTVITRNQLSYWQNSITLFERALAVTTDNATAHVSLGAALLENGRADEAATQFVLALHINPDYGLAHNNLGLALGHQGRIEEACEHFETALRLNAADAQAHFNYANTCNPGYRDWADSANDRPLPNNLVAKARRHYQEALQLDPGFAAAHLNWGNLEASQGQFSAALDHFKQATALNPALAGPWVNAAIVMSRFGQTNEAKGAYEKALELEPNRAETHFQLANLLASTGELDKAIDHFRKAIHLKPRRFLFHHNLGVALAKHGATEQAIQAYRTALGLESNSIPVLNNLAWLLATDPDKERRNGAEALRYARRACELTDYRDPRLLGTLDVALAETGEFSQAIATAQKAHDLAKARGMKQLAERTRTRLELYRAGRAFHSE